MRHLRKSAVSTSFRMDFGGQNFKMAALKSKSCDDLNRADALNELGLKDCALDEDIRSAFRQRLKQAHPDIHGGTDCRLRRLILARDLLMSEAKTISEPADNAINFHADNTLGDGATPLTITLAQALYGGTVTADVPALEFSHADELLTSLTQTKTLSVTLPCGLRNGVKLCLPCEGAARHEMYFEINIETDDHCRVWGDDIWMTATLDRRLLQYGGKTLIETPHGLQDIHLDRDVPHGASLCLKGKGLPATGTAPAGNLYIRLEAQPDVVRPVTHILSEFRQRWAS
ncbi:Chaperone protein DnaJ [Asticcacaulis sp. MM231]